jgi:hypothetical protein
MHATGQGLHDILDFADWSKLVTRVGSHYTSARRQLLSERARQLNRRHEGAGMYKERMGYLWTTRLAWSSSESHKQKCKPSLGTKYGDMRGWFVRSAHQQ